MMRDITNCRAAFSSSALDGTAENDVFVGGGHGPPRPVACKVSCRMTSVSELLTGDWDILSRDIR